MWIRTPTGWQETGLPGADALIVESDESFVLCGPGGVVRYDLEETVLSQAPCLDLVRARDTLWMLDEAGNVIDVERGAPVSLGEPVAPRSPTGDPDPQRPDGSESPDGAGSPLDLLAGGPEGAWLSGNRLVVGDSERLVFPGATDIAWVPSTTSEWRWVLVHPDRKLLGLLGESGLESAWPQPIDAARVAVGDLGNDGTLEIVIAGADGWMPLTLEGSRVVLAPAPRVVEAPPPVVVPPTPPPVWKPPQTTSLLGLRMPNFGSLDPDPDYDQMFVGGFGVAFGNALGPSQLSVGFSPAATGGIERGAKRIRSYFGADSAPLFAWIGDTGGIHLAMATAGVSIGSDRLRAGPFASIGLLGAGAGLRAVFTPFESRAGKLTGFEGRLTWFAPAAGHAALYYVSAFPLGRRYGPAEGRETRPSFCHRFGFGFGAAAGASSTEFSWEFVGREDSYQFSGSPAVTLACENGGKATGWHIGGESAPFFFYRVPTGDGGADRRLYQMGTMTLGLYAGGNRGRLGPIVTGGIWSLGAGVRAVVTPLVTRAGAHHGIELRALALFPSAPAGQGMLLYHVWFDPKVKKPKPALVGPELVEPAI